ncbi:type II toxin-antitoxin system HipA family toxin [Polaromonas sp.]|uniref:type II toxin-antitoxin system HipA family toxin n=1 Tax=Polaromonas sp. TaxID=1869339 RepID=UPI00356B36E6
MSLPEKLKDLSLFVANAEQASLAKRSVYSLSYAATAQHAVGLSLPIVDKVFQDGDLFAALDMNLPEGYLFERIVDRYPKFALSKMHLLALQGAGGIGRVSYAQPGQSAPPLAGQVSRAELLSGHRSQALFHELVETFLGAGSALSGVQPKVMVPVQGKAIVSAPNVIIKTEGARYPGLSANEWMCLTAARCAGLTVPQFDLSADGQLLVLDRFDILADGTRLGFEDMAAIMQLRVRDRLSSRKYIGSYEDIATALRLVCTDAVAALEQFFGYLALSVLVRNGDAHLKNFAVLYDGQRTWLSPLYDQVTTTIYTYERPGGIESADRTMALKLRRGGRSGEASRARSYPTPDELQAFGRDVCSVHHPAAVIARVQEGMRQALTLAQHNSAVPPKLRLAMAQAWTNAGLS